MFQIGVLTNRWVFVGIAAMLLLLLFTYTPFMNSLLQSAPISAAAWERVAGVGLSGYLLVELERLAMAQFLRVVERTIVIAAIIVALAVAFFFIKRTTSHGHKESKPL